MIDPDPNPADNITGWKAKVVKRFILANPDATIREVSKATRASERTVSSVRAVLLRAGLIQAAPTGRPAASPPETDAEEQIRRDIDAAIASGSAKILTRDERRQRLSAYADHPKVPHAAKIAALRELEATEPPEEEKKLGPGAPLTTEERVFRVALMLEALADIDGATSVYEAIKKAFPEVYLDYAEFFIEEREAKKKADARDIQPSPPPDGAVAEVSRDGSS